MNATQFRAAITALGFTVTMPHAASSNSSYKVSLRIQKVLPMAQFKALAKLGKYNAGAFEFEACDEKYRRFVAFEDALVVIEKAAAAPAASKPKAAGKPRARTLSEDETIDIYGYPRARR